MILMKQLIIQQQYNDKIELMKTLLTKVLYFHIKVTQL